jgi:hypothetical protein
MSLTRKDLAATVLTTLVVLVFLATHEGWNVWLVGGSHRWAAGMIFLIGSAMCGLGSPSSDRMTKMFGALGLTAFVLAALAVASGSLTPLSLLAADIVALWAIATIRHATGFSQTRAAA